jgi:hypothetical protein
LNRQAFLPRSDSKIVLAVVLASYASALDRLVLVIVRVFTPIHQPRSSLAAYGPWAEAADYLVGFPIVAAVVLVAFIELLRLVRLPVVLQIALAAAGSCGINGVFWRPMALVVAPLFLLCAFAYLRWRSASWWVALGYTVLIFAFEALGSAIGVFAHAFRNA